MSDTTGSALPSVMQKKVEGLRQQMDTPPAPTGEVAPAPAGDIPPPTPTGLPNADSVQTSTEKVTLSRDDYNKLQADADKASNSNATLERTQLELEEARHRLTELESRGKGGIDPAAPVAPAAPGGDSSSLRIADDVSIDPEEEEKFGESRAYVEKVAAKLVASLMNPILAQFKTLFDDVSNKTETVGQQVLRSQQDDFKNRVMKAVPDLEALINHKHWKDFLIARNELAGVTYEELLSHNISNGNVDGMSAIYKLFRDKYGITDTPSGAATGYEGAAVGGEGGSAQIPGEIAAKKLKWSDRKRASEDYRFGRNGMTHEKLQEIDKQFKAADAKGLVDYNA